MDYLELDILKQLIQVRTLGVNMQKLVYTPAIFVAHSYGQWRTLSNSP